MLNISIREENSLAMLLEMACKITDIRWFMIYYGDCRITIMVWSSFIHDYERDSVISSEFAHCDRNSSSWLSVIISYKILGYSLYKNIYV